MVTVMVMNDLLPHPLCNVNRHSHSEIQLFQNLTSKIHGQGHVYGQRSRPHLTFNIQMSRSNPLVTFEARSSIDMFAFCFVAIGLLLAEIKQISSLILKIQGQGHGQGQTWCSHLRPWVQLICLLFVLWKSDHFWLWYSKFYIWPWKFKVKVMAKVKSDGHIWALEFNRYVCFSFRGNQTIFGWVIANSIFALKIQGQGHGQGQIQWSHFSPRDHSICLLFVSWQSDHFWLRYSKFDIWLWKFKVKVMTKITQNLIR